MKTFFQKLKAKLINKKAAKITFFVSFVPYIIGLLVSISSIFFGVDFFGKVYGWNAFAFTALVYLAFFSTMIPILPICLLYEIGYIVYRKFGPFDKKGLKKLSGILAGIFVAGIGLFLLNLFSTDIEQFVDKQQAKTMIKKAEVAVPYNLSTINCDGILNIEGEKYDKVFVDYDTMTVGFLTSHSLERYDSFKLIKATDGLDAKAKLESEYQEQAVVPFPDGSGNLTVYCPQDCVNTGSTCAVLVERNGEQYYLTEKDKHGIRIYSALNGSDFSRLK